MKRPSFNMLLTQLLTLAVLAAIGVILAYGYSSAKHRADILVELAKTLLQLALIAVAGGIVSHLISDYVHKRTAAENSAGAVDRLRSEFLDEFRSSYYAVKSVRRALRAAGLTSKFNQTPGVLGGSQLRKYNSAMGALNRAQMNLEQLQIEIETFIGLSSENDSLIASIRKMENYLRRILKEFEEKSASAENAQQPLSFESLKALDDFTGASEHSSFRTDFSGQFRHARELLARDLLPLHVGTLTAHTRSPTRRIGS